MKLKEAAIMPAPLRPASHLQTAVQVAILVIAGVLAGGVATGCATKTVSTPATPVAPAATGSTGQGGQGNAPATGSGRDTGVVATFHGDGGAPYDSTAFAVHGGHVQLVYTAQPNETGPVPFLWAMYPQGAQPGPTNQRAGDSCPSCDGKQTN